MGKWNEASINKKPSGIKFDEVEVINDTAYYTGKDLSECRFPPTSFKNGVIPDAATAAQIAFQYVSAVFDKDCAIREQPYHIRLMNNQIWIIRGYLSPNAFGGTFEIGIEKYTGKIWYMFHDK
jgi:hypothetical protein